jgi:hypothetical protein
MTTSNRLGITELAETQNNRSVTVNEAIAKLEAGHRAYNGSAWTALAGSGGVGDVVGPGSAVNNNIALFDTTTGKLIKDSGVAISLDGTLASNSDAKIATEKATKTYVDGLAVNLGKRGRVRAATTANITILTALNNGDTLDGLTLATGEWVLVKDQSSAAENGVYAVGVVPARVSDFDEYDEYPGSLIAVEEGTANADTLWLCTSNAGGTINVTAIAFSQFVLSADPAPPTHAATSKVTPVDNDELPLVDSAASNVLKKLLWSNVKATLKTYFDTLYAAGSGTFTPASTNEVLTGTDTAKGVTADALAALWEKGADVASATTTSLGEGGFFHITGTTTITDIDWATAKDGRRAWLEFDGVLTITHNATTLVCIGGASILTEAGDRALVVQDNGDNVHMLDYVRKSGKPLIASVVGTPFEMEVACSDESTALTAGTSKITFRMPRAVTLTEVRASLVTAQTSGSIFTVDVNEAGTSVISTKLTIDNTEKTSTTAATPAVISDASLADDAEMTVDIDQIGDGTAKGLKIVLIGTRA